MTKEEMEISDVESDITPTQERQYDSEDESEVKKLKQDKFLPRTLRNLNTTFDSINYKTPLIKSTDPIILGVDEAGRGPILGPMVYTVAYCSESFTPRLRHYGFDDSKVLKHDFRLKLMKDMDNENHELFQVGHLTTVMSAKDISSGMLRVHGQGAYNLNAQAHDTTINLIKDLIKQNDENDGGLNIAHVYIDTVGPPEKYQAKLKSIFPNINFTVAKKADSKYPIVSAASIVAKVSRDLYLENYNESETLLKGTKIGSGYPSDPNTSAWLKQQVDKVFGWHYGLVRYSWQTARDSLINNHAAKVTYEEPDVGLDVKVSSNLFGSNATL
ncbi:ribonuclease H2 subunit A [[Candida] jaroonii]|uniref:Ribonuclease H2 subunit A n=1 Tax=[Candida] jaroonii TaxID=467808 RepID=A0ACA9YBA7_9ASCO|nr:ribonuclease H2 subunit A [[Candida] jaroonii]